MTGRAGEGGNHLSHLKHWAVAEPGIQVLHLGHCHGGGHLGEGWELAGSWLGKKLEILGKGRRVCVWEGGAVHLRHGGGAKSWISRSPL